MQKPEIRGSRQGCTLIDQSAKRGFTLIELSIVIVIIGLIVGGVLVGQDLIKAAEIRATVGQLEKYNTAVNTFRGKYNGMPGDLTNAATFGVAFITGQSTVAPVTTNGNGLVEPCTTTATQEWYFGCENKMFWNHLSAANMIENAFTDGGNNDTYAETVLINNTVAPTAKMGRGNFIMVSASAGVNYFRITGAGVVAAGVVTSTNALSPIEAYQIDTKMDDGVPIRGIAFAYDGANLAETLQAANGPPSTRCQDAGGVYNIANQANNQLCNLRVRASF